MSQQEPHSPPARRRVARQATGAAGDTPHCGQDAEAGEAGGEGSTRSVEKATGSSGSEGQELVKDPPGNGLGPSTKGQKKESSVEMNDRKPTFAGEVQFAGYSDSSRGGPRVTLRLADRDDLAKFIGKEGKRYMAVLVEIADDETPAAPSPAPAPKAPAPRAPRERMAPLCEWAVLRCAEHQFQDWCNDLYESGQLPNELWPAEPVPAAEWAKAVLCHLCGVKSRKDLDTDPAAAKRFHERVRAPYAKWLQEQGVTA